jgi:Anti-sigma-K factor rskA
MKPTLSADEWSELLAGYVLGDLNPAEIAAVEEYLTSSTAAQQELQQLQMALSLVNAANLTAIDTSPATASELASLERLRPSITTPKPQPLAIKTRQNQILFWLGWGLGSIATICATTFWWQNYQLDRQLSIAQQKLQDQQVQLSQSGKQLTVAHQEIQSQQALLMQSGNKLLAINGMDAGRKSTGSLVMSPAANTAVLVLQKVPPLPMGKVYRMWAVVDGEDMACGDFLPDKSGQVIKKTSMKDWQRAKTVVITIESAKESTIPAGDAVMMGGEKIDL